MRMETSSSSSSRAENTIECNGSSSECEESAETSSFTTDESLADYGLPEMVVFLQDFKDIGIDTGVQSEDKFSLEIQDSDPEIITVLRPSDLGRMNEQTVSKTGNTMSCFSNSSTSPVEDHSNEKCQLNFVTRDEESDNSYSNKTHRKLLLISDVDPNCSCPQPFDLNRLRHELKKDELVEETTMRNSMASSMPEKIIQANSECLTNARHCTNMVIDDEGDGSGRKLHQGGRKLSSLRELMFETPVGLSPESSIDSDNSSCVHPTPCVGSNACIRVSIRSNFSTTSLQSFAFPVLPRVWIGSPVRMAEPDKNRMWKHQGWRR